MTQRLSRWPGFACVELLYRREMLRRIAPFQSVARFNDSHQRVN